MRDEHVIAEWIRDFTPSLVPLDLDKGLAVWRDFGWLVAGLGLWMSAVTLPDLYRALRTHAMPIAVANAAFILGGIAMALGMAAVDIGWLVLGMAVTMGSGFLLNTLRS